MIFIYNTMRYSSQQLSKILHQIFLYKKLSEAVMSETQSCFRKHQAFSITIIIIIIIIITLFVYNNKKRQNEKIKKMLIKIYQALRSAYGNSSLHNIF